MQAARRLQLAQEVREKQTPDMTTDESEIAQPTATKDDNGEETREDEQEEQDEEEEDNEDNNEDNDDENDEEDVEEDESSPCITVMEAKKELMVGSNSGASDLAKNIEIRRLSCTEDGDKIIEPTFHSPEKEAGQPRKNPLENILNFVSGMEMPTVNQLSEEQQLRGGPGGSRSSRNSSPVLSGGGVTPGSPMMCLKGRKGRQQVQSQFTVVPHSPPPWVLRGGPPAPGCAQLVLSSQQQQLPLFQATGHILTAGGGHPQTMTAVRPATNNQTMFIATAGAPQIQYHQAVLPGSPAAYVQPTAAVMQLIQTVNGPILVPLGTASHQPQTLYQLQAQPSGVGMDGAAAFSSTSSSPQSSSSSPGSSVTMSPKGRKGATTSRKRKAETQASCQARSQLLISPSGHQGLVNLHPVLGPHQQVVTHHQGELVASGLHHMISLGHHQHLHQPANSLIVNHSGPASSQVVLPGAVTNATPAVYQQLPDGTLVQLPVQSAPATQIIQHPQLQPATGAGPGHIFLNNTAGGAVLTASGGGTTQFLMTPQGLVQAIGAALPPTHSPIFQNHSSTAVVPSGHLNLLQQQNSSSRVKEVRQPASKKSRRDPIPKAFRHPDGGNGSGGHHDRIEQETVVERDEEEDEADEEEDEDDNEDGDEEEEEEEKGEEENPNDQASKDDTDTSYEEVRPSSSKKTTSSHHHHHHYRSSSSSSIQSNKVDSSGLNATPPHQKEQGDFEQLRSERPSADESLELDTSYLDLSRNSEAAMEEEEDEEDSETDVKQQQLEEQEQEQLHLQHQQQQQPHVSSSVKKKKKKKSADDYLREQSILYGKRDTCVPTFHI
jgi:hypothetical protein